MTRKRAEQKPTRREFVLGAIGGVTTAALLGGCERGSRGSDGGFGGGLGGGSDGGVDAGSDGGLGGGSDAGAGGGLDAGSNADGATCTVYPQQTEGPYYLDLNRLRRDITEGKPGMPLRLVVQVVSAVGCAPLKDIAVDVWQADASGAYSGYAGQPGGIDTTGQTFLRGTQITGDDGRVQFDTIYPGWYPGRTTHIHFKVHLSSTLEATSQLYFPEDVTAAVYQTAPYSARGQKDTSNAADQVTQGNIPPLLALTSDGTGYLAALTVAVAGSLGAAASRRARIP
jgi:protocatechuate 3,4-dioxygenase beta subunit